MHAHRNGILTAGTALVLVLAGCASGASDDAPAPQVTETSSTQNAAPEQGSDPEPAAAGAEISIPAGAYAAAAEFPFPIPEGWAVLDAFTEGKLGKNVTMDGSVEYPGDAQDAAATYLGVLEEAGFDAYPYAPGAATNQASLAADGVINGTRYLTILNFDVHADGYQRVSITAAEKD